MYAAAGSGDLASKQVCTRLDVQATLRTSRTMCDALPVPMQFFVGAGALTATISVIRLGPDRSGPSPQ